MGSMRGLQEVYHSALCFACGLGFSPFSHGAGSALSQMCPRASVSSESGLETATGLVQSSFSDFTNLHLDAAESPFAVVSLMLIYTNKKL